jgi:hypothetical protein
MATWRRADPPGISTLMALVFVIIGVVITAVITVVLIAGAGHWVVNAVLGIFSIYGFMAMWTGFAWRIYRTGIYVSDQAVLIVYPWRSRIVPWSDVAAVNTRQAMLSSWTTVRDAIFLKLTDGNDVETPVQRRTGWFAAGAPSNIGPVLGAADFDATLSFLREMRDQVTAT